MLGHDLIISSFKCCNSPIEQNLSIYFFVYEDILGSQNTFCCPNSLVALNWIVQLIALPNTCCSTPITWWKVVSEKLDLCSEFIYGRGYKPKKIVI